MDRHGAGLDPPEKTATDNEADSQVSDAESSDKSLEVPARIEKRALASLHRQQPRPVLKRKGDAGESSGLHERRHPQFMPSLSSPRSTDRRAAGARAYALPDSYAGFADLAYRLRQLEHENRVLRRLLMASTCSCDCDSEASCQDVIQLPEAEEHSMADSRNTAVSPSTETPVPDSSRQEKGDQPKET